MIMQKNARPTRLFFWVCFFEGLCFYAPVASLYRLEFGLNLFEITLIESLMLGFTLLLELPWGMLTARIGYKRTLVLAGVLQTLSALLFWRAYGFWGFLAQRLVLGAAVSGFSGCDVAYLCRLVPPESQAKALGSYNAVAYVSLLVVGASFPLVLPFGYRALALLTLVFTVISAVMRLGLPNLPAEPQDLLPIKKQLKGLKALLAGNKSFLVFLCCGAALFELEHTMTVFFASPSWVAVGIDKRWYGLLSLSLNGAGLLGGLCAGALIVKWGRTRTLTACWLASAVAGVAVWLLFGPVAVLISLPLLRFCTECYRPCEQLLKNERTGGIGRAVAISAYNMAASCTAVFIGPILGAVSENQPKNGMAVGAAMLCAFMLIAMAAYKGSRKGRPYGT